jgi:hypothetical protein
MGRAPEAGDLILPSRLGDHRSVNQALKKFHEDCDRIGLRTRRLHDLRRTFITLARTDGARKDVLEVVTHGSRGDIVDVYSSLPWQLLCEEIAKLKLALPTYPTLTPDGEPSEFATALATGAAEGTAQIQQRPGTIADSGPFEFAGWTGLENAWAPATG